MSSKPGKFGATGEVTRDQFIAALAHADRKEDRFAWTFRAKADAMGLWPLCKGFWGRGGLEGVIIVRCSKREPIVANLQLLHTFARFRRRGIAALLTKWQFLEASENGARYFRVSAEQEALPFYRALGFRFWGEQKSGSELSMFRIPIWGEGHGGPGIEDGVYDATDPAIRAAVYSGRRGGVVKLHEGGPL